MIIDIQSALYYLTEKIGDDSYRLFFNRKVVNNRPENALAGGTLIADRTRWN
jgi:hypothetical protein